MLKPSSFPVNVVLPGLGSEKAFNACLGVGYVFQNAVRVDSNKGLTKRIGLMYI